MDRMQRENDGRNQRRLALPKHACRNTEDEVYHRRVQEDVLEVKGPRRGSEDLVGKQIADHHEGPVIVSRRAGVGPYGGRENLTQVPKALDIWVVQHLGSVVVDEIAEQRVRIRHHGTENQDYHNRPLWPSRW